VVSGKSWAGYSDRDRSTARQTLGKSMTFRRIEKIFNFLPNPMDWLSFFKNDLPLLMDF